MKLGVIICPQCKQAKGMDLNSKTTKCPSCGKTLTLKKLNIFYTADSQEKLRQMIGQLNAEQDGKRTEFRNLLRVKR